MSPLTSGQHEARSDDERARMAVLACLSRSFSPMGPSQIADTLVAATVSVPVADGYIEARLDELKEDGYVQQLSDQQWRVTSSGQSFLGPLSQRPLKEIWDGFAEQSGFEPPR